MIHETPASIGFLSSLKSWPDRRKPFSIRSVSLAPSPIGLTSGLLRISLQSPTAYLFGTDLEIKGIGKFRGVFIRAPLVTRVRGGEILASFEKSAVMISDGKNLGLSFHPEIYGNGKIHDYFISRL